MGTTNYDYTDETVLITGASSGIGRQIARRFGEAGATVINADVREQPKGDSEVPTHRTIREAGGSAEFVETDVTQPDQVAVAVEAARDYGGVDIMVNNAAMHMSKPFTEVDPGELDSILSVNVKGVFVGTQVAATDMIDRDEQGTIINTASISSNSAQHNQVPYDMTKGAIRMITRGTALELAEDGIRVNAVAPGQIATEFFEGWSEKAINWVENNELIKPVPLNRAGTPEDVAGAYLYLASEDANYVTGELLHVDGGWQVC